MRVAAINQMTCWILFPLLLLQNKFLVTWKRWQYMLANAMHAASSCSSNTLKKKGCFRLKITLVLLLFQPLQCKKALLWGRGDEEGSVSCDKVCRPNSTTFNCGNVFRWRRDIWSQTLQKLTCGTYPTLLLYRGTGLWLPTQFLPWPKRRDDVKSQNWKGKISNASRALIVTN